MSKMGIELERRLNENKYEMLGALGALVYSVSQGAIDKYDLEAAQEVIAKVEGK